MTDSSSDSDLLRAYVEDGREAAFSELVVRHLGLVYRSALRQLGGDSHAAQDVAQAVFTLLARKASGLLNHTSLVGWLHTTTRRMAKDTIRSATRRGRREQEAMTMNSPETAPNWQVLDPVIDDALAELEEPDRTAVLLRYFSGLPFAAVGAKLGIAENAARMRVDRALEKLRVSLHRRGIESTGVALSVVLANEAVGTTIPAGLAAQVSHTAVSTAGVGAAAAGGAAVLLSVGKLATLASIALLTTSIALVSYGLYTRHDARQRLARAERQLRSSEDRARAASERAASLDQHLRALRASVAKAQADAEARTAEIASAAKEPTEWDPRAEGAAFMERHPEVKSALRDWVMGLARFHYGPLLQELNLSPAQADRFLALMANTNALLMPFGPGGRQLEFSLSDDDWTKTLGAELDSLLGKDGTFKFQKYQLSMRARDDVASLASSLAVTDAPMTAEQAAALTTAFVAHTQSAPGKSQPAIDWPALTEAAQGILTPAQLASFTVLQTEIITRQKQMVTVPPPAPTKGVTKQ